MKNDAIGFGVVIGLIIFVGMMLILSALRNPKEEPVPIQPTEEIKVPVEEKPAKGVITDVYKFPVITNPLTINWWTNAGVIKTCNVDPTQVDANSVDACSDINQSIVEMSYEKKFRQKEFDLHHELGHIIYRLDFPRDIFKPSVLLPDYEQIAEDFAWWIEGQEYEEEAEFAKSVLTKAEIDYFESTCNVECVKFIMSIKIR